jgi:hypothetical protein
MIGLTAAAFGIAWWLGLYLLARDPGKPVLRRAGLGLFGYAGAVVVDQLGLGGVAHVGVVLVCLPALAWSGVFVLLADDSGTVDRWWRFGLLPLWAVSAAGVLAGFEPAVIALAVLAGLALSGGVVALVRRWPVVRRRDRVGLVLVASLMVMLVGWLLLLGFEVVPSGLLLACMAPDLAALGWVIAAFDAFDEGEVLAPDMLRSALVAAIAAVVFGGQVGIAMALRGESLLGLLYGTVAAAIAVQVLATPLQAGVDRVALRSGRLRRARGELREVADALARKDSASRLAELDEAEFARLTRRALSHYGDLGKLVSNPLVDLPVIATRLADRRAADAPLERATELKSVLGECIAQLKPNTDDEFGTSEEWRYYNALYFYYVRGIRPYSVRTKRADLDHVCRRALSWFADQVPQRTLHNWQTTAARIIARELRSGIGESVH